MVNRDSPGVLRETALPMLAVEIRFAADLDEVLAELRALLIAKNKAYGDSALNPIRILSKADPRDLILARIDDKFKRVTLGSAAGEDVWLDILGYFTLLRIYDLRQKQLTSGV